MRAFARSIVETVRHPLVILDAGLRVVAVNPTFSHIFSVEQADIQGRPVYELGGGVWDTPAFRALLDDVISTGRQFERFQVDYDAPGPGRRHLLMNARRVCRDEDGGLLVLLGIEDETDQRRIGDELLRLNAELEDRVARRTTELATANQHLQHSNRELESTNRELEAFCYSVSHDLRSPLRAVDGFSQELLQRYADRMDDQGRHYLRRVRAGTQRMGQLIDDLLKLSRVSRSEMHLERVDLTALAENVAAELREREPGRTISFTAQPGLTTVCDPRLIRVVLENLLGNAWKFTGKNLTARVVFGCVENGGGSTFCVRDDGAGFDMLYVGKLFGAFQRLHADRDFPGTGIGLATVQRVIRRHGGEVWAESEPGRGAVFSFALPTSEGQR